MLIFAISYFLVSALWLWIFARMGGRVGTRTLLLAFGLGVISGPVAGLISWLIETNLLTKNTAGAGHLRNFLLYFLIVGPVEEIAKFLALFLATFRAMDFRNSSDGILLAIAAALGFAGGENVLYLLALDVERTLPRLILGNLGHAAFSVYGGYALGVVMHENASPSLIVAALTLASLFHGAYNYFLTLSIAGAMVSFLLSGLLYVLMLKLIRAEKERNR